MTGHDIDAEIARKRALIQQWRDGLQAERDAAVEAERRRKFWARVDAKAPAPVLRFERKG